jgi:FKBP-type peptidyl-prolyl cis-trans isomerase (trigger factor)
MKKKLVAAVLCAAMVISVSACGSSDTNTEAEGGSAVAVESTESGETTISSLDIEVDALSCVTTLADYNGIDVSLTGDYAVTEEDVEDIFDSILSSAGIDTREVTDRTTVQEGDLVNVDYTGYLDGEAFDGGSATGSTIEISDDNGFIPGFTDGLIGAEVGTTLDCPVTFPENYGSDTLAGQDAVFTFTINGIYEKVTVETLSDDAVEENFSDKYDVHTAQELWNYVKDYLTDQAISNFIENYMLENSEVTVPEDYLEARINEYQEYYATTYFGDLDTMESYMEYYGITLEDYIDSYIAYYYSNFSSLKEYLESSIKLQLIFEAIAIKENMEVDEEEFQDYIQSTYLNSSSYSYEDEQDLYESVGNGDMEKGKAYLQKMYLTNLAYDFVIDNANVEEG